MQSHGGDLHYRLAVVVSIAALRSLLLLNGGAAAVLIISQGKGGDGAVYSLPVILFVMGALGSIFSLICVYLAQLSYAKHWRNMELKQFNRAETRFASYKMWHWFALLFFTLGLLLCGGGLSVALSG